MGVLFSMYASPPIPADTDFLSSNGDAPTQDRFLKVPFQYSAALPEILTHLNASIIASTYQAGKLLVIGVHQQQLQVSFLDFEQPMGIAVGADRIAIGAKSEIQFFKANHAAATTVEPRGVYDGCYIAHTSRHTGRILGHDLGWGREGLWVVNTLFSCLCTLDDTHSFVPRWKPSIISRLADEDRCHLNGMAMENGAPRYVTALAETDTAAGRRPNKAHSGCLIDVNSGEVIREGLSMPHSPRVSHGHLWVLDSGNGCLAQVDRTSGRLQPVEHVPGYTRGLAFGGQFAFVGLSRIRESNVFGGLPIAERCEQLRCGIAVVDLTTGRSVATFEFLSGVEEIFAVDVIPNHRHPVFGGASSDRDQHEIWIVPAAAAHVPTTLGSNKGEVDSRLK
jgi:uncharacterized protein (TIGR03032 family)